MEKIGFIGAGNMAKALAVGIATSAKDKLEILISDPNEAACQAFKNSVGDAAAVSRVDNNQKLISQSQTVFLAVKPQYLVDAIEGVEVDNDPLFISIVPGFRFFHLERLLGSKRIIRVMPNTPCMVGQGASGLSAGEAATDSDVALVSGFLESVGKVVVVDESLMDSVTGLSGSGPAFVLTFIEAMIDAGVAVGLPRDKARTLAIQTVAGTAELLVSTGDHPGVLRDQVTSPGGTTIAGLKSLEETAFRDSVMSAVIAAAERASELGD